ncbi:recombinase family protein [uncultured Oscillibacter sp.]|uniref:recombinase family protein n=1 Tax=uncultured Oscillibacter sp. TaxID=876091 RepID=UPI0026305077|nr:recombinase family protein [uncultured Oscillibacter sp.]
MKIPYGYTLINEEIIVNEEKADVVRSIFGYYLAGASLGKIVDMLSAKGIPSPSGNSKWGRAAVDKLLSNAKYIPIVGVETYMDAQFERECRRNVDYDKAGHPRRTVRYQSPSLKIN